MDGLPRSSRAPKPPAQRVVELTQEVARLEERLVAVGVKMRELQADYRRWHQLNDTSFGGIAMAQYQCDLLLWESVLNGHPQLGGIVEIGTWLGGLSWWLHAQALARGMSFLTVDVIAPPNPPPGFRQMDVWREKERLLRLIRMREPVALFCDGGNKPRELREFAMELRHPESIVFVHDWGTETKPEDVPEGLEMLYGDYCDGLGGITRVFRRVP